LNDFLVKCLDDFLVKCLDCLEGSLPNYLEECDCLVDGFPLKVKIQMEHLDKRKMMDDLPLKRKFKKGREITIVIMALIPCQMCNQQDEMQEKRLSEERKRELLIT
jgi:hypothetical protein